jgi:hypothetical protein
MHGERNALLGSDVLLGGECSGFESVLAFWGWRAVDFGGMFFCRAQLSSAACWAMILQEVMGIRLT